MLEQEMRQLAEEAADLPDFLTRACELRGMGTTRASAQAGLSRNTFSTFINRRRRPGTRSVYAIASFFGVSQSAILRLAGLPTLGEGDVEWSGLLEPAADLLRSLNPEEISEWLQYGEMMILRRQRRILEEATRDVAGKVAGDAAKGR